jgi:hypothetical protein
MKILIPFLLFATIASAEYIIDGDLRAGNVLGYDKTHVIDAKLSSLESELAAGRRLYYCVQASQTLTGLTYGVLSVTPQVSTYTVAIGPITNTTNFIQYSPGRGRITKQGLGVTSIPAGSIQQTLYFTNSNTSNRNVDMKIEAYLVDADGFSNPSFIATSNTETLEAFGSGNIQRVQLDFIVNPAFATGGMSRRLKLEYYFIRSGTTTGTPPTVTRHAGGTQAGLLSIQVPSTVVMLTDASNAEVSDVLTNLGVRANNFTDEYTLTESPQTHTITHNLGTYTPLMTFWVDDYTGGEPWERYIPESVTSRTANSIEIYTITTTNRVLRAVIRP